jgi:hypothetical protein
MGQLVVSQTYDLEVARGLVAGVTRKTLNGYDAAVGVVQEPIWAESGAQYPFPTAAQTITVSSSDVNDTAAGTGAQTVAVTYIDFTSRSEVTTVVALNGQTGVTVSTNAYRVNGFVVMTAGSNKSNLGTVYCGYGALTVGKPASVLSSIVIGKNTHQQLIYTVPEKKILELKFFRFTTSALAVMQFHSKTDTGVDYVNFDLPMNGAVDFETVDILFAARTDIYMTGAAAVSCNVGCIFTGRLRDNFLT